MVEPHVAVTVSFARFIPASAANLWLGLTRPGRPPPAPAICSQVRPAAPWWKAEENHQNYLKKGGLDPEAEAPYWLGSFVDME